MKKDSPRTPWCLAFLLLAGCGPDPDTPMRTKTYDAPAVRLEDRQRVEVTRIGVFRDDIAYNTRRGIYVIQDRQTGKEYIGVSGVGITETGSHSNGKTSAADER